MGTEDFDRSFEFFADPKNNDSFNAAAKRPASSSVPTTPNTNRGDDASFDSNVFEFAVTNEPVVETAPKLFVLDNSSDVQIAVHERLSAMYDDVSQEGSVTVTGAVYLQSHNKERFKNKLRMILRDNAHRVHRVEPQTQVCVRKANEDGQRVFEVLPRPQSESPTSNKQTLLLHYFCVPKLRPVPLLIKNRVSVSNGMARVGFKIRANPHNTYTLSNIMVLLAIPPDMDGEKCKMSHKGGAWEEMKRTISWCLEDLVAGQAIEIQAQFPLLETLEKPPKFPVLVRCDFCDQTFSGVDVEVLGSTVRKSVRVLHRKV